MALDPFIDSLEFRSQFYERHAVKIFDDPATLRQSSRLNSIQR